MIARNITRICHSLVGTIRMSCASTAVEPIRSRDKGRHCDERLMVLDTETRSIQRIDKERRLSNVGR